MASNLLLSIVLISTLVIKELASVTVRKGARASIPCTVEITSGEDVLAAYWHKSNGTVVDDILVSLENGGVISGPGYENGEFTIAEDLSLIINKVTLNDGGNYTCVILVQSSGWRISSTFVEVYIEPPTPQIDKCLFNSVGGNLSQTCTYIVADHGHDELSITCFVLGDFSNINLFFQNQSGVISEISGQSQIDGVNIRYVTILAVHRSEPYECVARNQESSNGESSTSILLRQQLVEANSNDTSEEVKSDEVKCSPQAVIWLSVLVCLSLLVIILLARKEKWILFRLRKYVTQIFGTLVQNHFDDLETHPLIHRQLAIQDEHCDTKKKYQGIASSTGEDDTFRIWECDSLENNQADPRIEVTEVMKANSLIESVHCYNYTSASAMSAGALCSIPSLRMLRLVNVNLDNSFYQTIANEATKLKKIETLMIIDNHALPLNEESSRCLVQGVRSLPNLRNLHLVCGSLQEPFFEILSEADNEKMKKLWFSMHETEEGNGQKMEKFVKALAHMKALQTLGISVESVTEAHLAACLRKLSGLQNLRISGAPMPSSEDASCNLLNEIAQFPSLQALYLLRPGERLLDLPVCSSTNAPLDTKLTTLILREVTLSEATMRAVLSIGALCSVRFMSVNEEISEGAISCDQMQKSSSRTNKVEEIGTDVNSLPVLLRLGLPSCCPNVNTLQVDFTRDIRTKDIERMQELKSVTTLVLKAFRKPSFFFCSPVSLEDETVLRDAMESLTNINELCITDIAVGDEEASEILKSAPPHLKRLVMTRCNTTDNRICQELTRDLQFSITHGTPDTNENGKGSRYKDYLQNTDQMHFDAHFEVIVRD